MFPSCVHFLFHTPVYTSSQTHILTHTHTHACTCKHEKFHTLRLSLVSDAFPELSAGSPFCHSYVLAHTYLCTHTPPPKYKHTILSLPPLHFSFFFLSFFFLSFLLSILFIFIYLFPSLSPPSMSILCLSLFL